MLIRVSHIVKGGRLMVSYTYASYRRAQAYLDAAALIEGGKCSEVFVSEVPYYAYSPETPYHFKQQARRVNGQWMVSLTKMPLK